MKIILASNSPRRKQLLIRLGFKFDIIPSDIDESQISTKINAQEYCILLAKLKAEKISINYPNALIIGADTIVVIENQILNKPNNNIEAKNMLKMLSGKTHEVHTGVFIKCIEKNIQHSFNETSKVTFNEISEEEIIHYINTYKPFDKAGSYGIQDWFSVQVKKVEGCYFNVMGLPLAAFYKEYRQINNQLEML